MIFPTLTPEQAEYLREKIAKDVVFQDDGEIDIEANAASAIYHQLSVLEAVTPNNIWVSLYKIETAYGGPEEGGWTYDNYQLLFSAGFSNYQDTEKYWSILLSEVMEDATQEERQELMPFEKDFIAALEDPEAQLPYNTIKRGRYGRTDLFLICLERVRGQHTTWRKPIYC